MGWLSFEHTATIALHILPVSLYNRRTPEPPRMYSVFIAGWRFRAHQEWATEVVMLRLTQILPRLAAPVALGAALMFAPVAEAHGGGGGGGMRGGGGGFHGGGGGWHGGGGGGWHGGGWHGGHWHGGWHGGHWHGGCCWHGGGYWYNGAWIAAATWPLWGYPYYSGYYPSYSGYYPSYGYDSGYSSYSCDPGSTYYTPNACGHSNYNAPAPTYNSPPPHARG